MKRLTGLTLMLILASVILGAFALPAFAAEDDWDDEDAMDNIGGVIVGEGDAPDCVGGSCGGVVVEDPHGSGPNCDGGNCGGSICAGPDCGSCEGGNCGGSISGAAEEDKKKKKEKEQVVVTRQRAARELPRTGSELPTASTLALGAGMLLVGTFFVFLGHPATKLAWSMVSYRPRRRL